MKRFLRLLLTNAFGLKSKLGELAHVAKCSSPDVIAVTETKFSTAKVTDSEVCLSGYAPPIRHDRNAHGGGVAIWVKSNMAFQHLDRFSTEHHEVIWISVSTTSRSKIVICALYRSGSTAGTDTELIEYLDTHLDEARSHGDYVILAGDFNVHNAAWLGSTKTTSAGEAAEELCYVHGLEQHVSIPTRGDNTLDLVMSDFSEPVQVKCHAPLGSSDHAVLTMDFPISAFREPKTTRTVWRYNQTDWNRLCHFFLAYDCSTAFTTSADEPCANITEVILQGMSRFVPSRQLTSRPTDPAWWTPECTDAIKAKERAWATARRQKSTAARQTASAATLRCNDILQHAKVTRLATLRTKLSKASLSDRSWWSTIKQAGGSSRNTSIPTLTPQPGLECVSNAEKAECFGQYFASKCSLGADDIPANQPATDFPHVAPRTAEKLSTVRFRPATVKRELRRLNASKATGPDCIPARVLKMCAHPLSKPLSKLFSLSFYSMVMPICRKTAKVTPIHKKKSKNLPRHYRPVSLLSIISKVMETIVNRQITSFVESHNVIFAKQFGFRKGLSTADVVTKLHCEWSRASGLGGAAHVLVIDIAGAFDKVSHAGLLHKASVYGLEGPLLGRLESYVHNRRLQAVVGGQESSLHHIQAGVPKGSILGPKLFLLYVNDCEDTLPPGAELATYADDTTLYQCISATASISDSAAHLQEAVDAVSHWGSKCKVTFEPSKSQALIIDHRKPPPAFPPVLFNGVTVPEEKEIKHLGIAFDSQLSYAAHLRAVASKAAQRLHFLRKVAPLLDSSGRTAVYKGVVRPTMEYCCLVWMGSGTPRLDKIQHKALKEIGPGAWLPSLKHRRLVAALSFTFKLSYLPTTSPLKPILPPPANPRPTGGRSTRLATETAHCHPLQLKSTLPVRIRSSLQGSYPDCIIPLWNSLPATILPARPQPSQLQSFKENATSICCT